MENAYKLGNATSIIIVSESGKYWSTNAHAFIPISQMYFHHCLNSLESWHLLIMRWHVPFNHEQVSNSPLIAMLAIPSVIK